MLGIVVMAFVHLLSVSLPADGLQIRLVNGTCRCSGRMEVHHGGQWGTVCAGYWDMNNTAVVCRQLGCGSPVSVLHGAHFCQGSGEIWRAAVNCSGSESSLAHCPHHVFGNCSCDCAYVVCSGNMSQPTLSLSSPYSPYSPGEVVSFRCNAPADICPPIDFCLHKLGAGSPLTCQLQSRESSVQMDLNNVNSHQGSYTCLYTVQGNQTLNSSHSNAITITNASMILPVSLGVSAGLLVLVLLSVILFLVFWNRRHGTGRTRVVKRTTNACTMKAYYPRGQVSEEEEEQDYVNVHAFKGTDSEEEEDVYVNCSQPVKNKCHEDENIYQN